MLGEKIGGTSGKITLQRVLQTWAEIQKWKLRFRRMDQYWAQT
jgi:hypothetical protein